MRVLVPLLSLLTLAVGAARLYYAAPRPVASTRRGRIFRHAVDAYLVIAAIALGVVLLVLMAGVITEITRNLT